MKRVEEGDESGESRTIARHRRVSTVRVAPSQRSVARDGVDVIGVRDKEGEL